MNMINTMWHFCSDLGNSKTPVQNDMNFFMIKDNLSIFVKCNLTTP